MSDPFDGPPEEPGSTPAPGQQPYPQQPGQPWPYQPPPTGVRAGPLIGGLVLGLFAGLVATIGFGLAGALLSTDGSGVWFALPQLVPLAVSVGLLCFRRTRMAGAGLVMGIAIGAIVMPGLCISLVSGGAL